MNIKPTTVMYGFEVVLLLVVAFRLIRWALAFRAGFQTLPGATPGVMPAMQMSTTTDPDGAVHSVAFSNASKGGANVSVRVETKRYVFGPGAGNAGGGIPQGLLDSLTAEQRKLVLDKLQEAEKMIAGLPTASQAPKPGQ
jgi:hypothetical protein